MLTISDLQGSSRQRRRDRMMRAVFMAAAMTSMVISVVILFTLLRGAFDFMRAIDWKFGKLSDSGWYPRKTRFDLRTIVVGSAVIGSIAMIVAIPFGLGTAVYLSEYAPPGVRSVLKPIIEVLAGMPSVVVGLFVIKFVAPHVVDPVFHPTRSLNMLAAGLGIGILVIPIMASVSEDALRAVPGSLREASYGCGARKVTTTAKIVLPAAVSGLVAASIIAVSRAIGETMVATMAGGTADSAVWKGPSPLQPGMTMTAAMTNAVGGSDAAASEAGFKVLYFVGLLLFLITLTLNTVGDRYVRRVRQKY